jgi:hypothetical protein
MPEVCWHAFYRNEYPNPGDEIVVMYPDGAIYTGVWQDSQKDQIKGIWTLAPKMDKPEEGNK